MAIVYRIYSNGGTGGSVDYSSAIAATPRLTYTTGMLTPSGTYCFGVRAYDDATGIEESNTQATIRLVLDGRGRDTGKAPNSIHALVARPTAAGGCRIAWAYHPAGQATPPTSFQVYLTAGSIPDLTTPQTSVAYQAGVLGYTCVLNGLSDAVIYTVSVVARSADILAVGEIVSTSIRCDSTPPDEVDDFIATAIN